jgi:hypothetical protein
VSSSRRPRAALTDHTMWFKGISGLALPLQASPVVGGVVR